MREFSLPSPQCVRDICGPKTDYWLLTEAGELANAWADVSYERRFEIDQRPKWYGGTTRDISRNVSTGDNSVVAKSDEMLSEMAKYMPESQRRGYLMDVAGAVPCVPTFLAGNPLNMRRRVRIQDEYAPLAIVYDPTCSAVIKTDQIFQRGIIVLALVRALAGLRPIELWVGGGLDANERKDAGYALVRIDTAPLDLARAAWTLTSAQFVRGVAYSLIKQKFRAKGAWPYNNYRASIGANFRDIVLQAMPHVSDVLAIPAIHAGDEMLADPRAWLARTFREVTNQKEAA